jgi:hypothetical protein
VDAKIEMMKIEGQVAVKVLQGQALTSIGVLVSMPRVILRAVRGMSGISGFSFVRVTGDG